MAVITDTPSTHHVHEVHESSSNMGWVLGLAILALLALALFYYGLPALRSVGNSGGTNINVPDKIDVNYNNPGNPGVNGTGQ
jgi:hypothetical protein